MTFAVYPLVYLPVAATLRHADPGPGGGGTQPRRRAAAHVLAGDPAGRPGWRWSGGACWWPWSCWPSTAPSRSSATGPSPRRSSPSSRSGFNAPAACALSLVLVALLAGGGARRGRRPGGGAGWPAPGPLAARATRRHRLGRATVPALAGMVALAVLALGVPLGAIVYWLFGTGGSTLPSASLGSALWHTALYSAAAGLLATAAAVPVALLSLRYPGRRSGPHGAQHLPGAGHVGSGHRAGPDLRLRALRRRHPLPERPAAGGGLRRHVLPAGPGGGADLAGPGAGGVGGGGPLARPGPAGGAAGG